MLIESEPRRPPGRRLELLDAVAARIAPDAARLAEWTDRYRREHRDRLGADLELVARHAAPGARLLEYGAVPLLLTAALDELGYDVSALDLAPDRFGSAIAELRLDVRRCDVERQAVPFASATFDLVLFNEIFEHLRIDPVFTLGEALRVLRPRGVLLLSTPNLRSWRGLRHLLLHDRAGTSAGDVYEQYRKLETLGHMGHVREYTVTETAEFLRRVGFVVERVVHRGGHGTGVVGLAERLAPRLRPFFTLVARPDASRRGAGSP